MDIFHLHRGDAPLLVSLPHDGTHVPDAIAARMTAAGRRVADTDWHVGRLYDFARELGASILRPTHSRYVVDLNRPPDGHALYPGRSETGLCPRRTFADEAIYPGGLAPSDGEVAERVRTYWQPYHDALAGELDRLRGHFGRVVLWEGHSIRSRVPMFFAGRLSDLNLGTADGASCGRDLADRLAAILADQHDYTWVANGRFKGGYITRHYGRPAARVDAVQMEIAQVNYMDEDSFAYDQARAAKLQDVLRRLLDEAIRTAARSRDAGSSTPLH